MPTTAQLQKDSNARILGYKRDIANYQEAIDQLKENGLTEQERVIMKGLEKNIRHKRQVIANEERRTGAKISLMEKQEAGIYGEGPDPEFVNLQGKKLEEYQKIYGDQIKTGQNLAEVQAKIQSGEIAPYVTKTIEVKEHSYNLPPPIRSGGGTPQAELQEIDNEQIVIGGSSSYRGKIFPLTPEYSYSINQQQANKPIRQTISNIEPYEVEQPEKRTYSVIGLTEQDRLGEKKYTEEADIIAYFGENKKINIDPIFYGSLQNIGGQFALNSYRLQDKYRSYMDYAEAQQNEFIRLGALAGSTFAKTTYDLTLGIPVTAIKEGPAEAILQFNPVRLVNAIREDKIFVSKDQEGRIAETLGIIGGIDFTHNVYKLTKETFKEFKNDVNFKRWEEGITGEPYKPNKGFLIMEDTGAITGERQAQLKPGNYDIYKNVELPRSEKPIGIQYTESGKPLTPFIREPISTKQTKLTQDISIEVKKPTESGIPIVVDKKTISVFNEFEVFEPQKTPGFLDNFKAMLRSKKGGGGLIPELDLKYDFLAEEKSSIRELRVREPTTKGTDLKLNLGELEFKYPFFDYNSIWEQEKNIDIGRKRKQGDLEIYDFYKGQERDQDKKTGVALLDITSTDLKTDYDTVFDYEYDNIKIPKREIDLKIEEDQIQDQDQDKDLILLPKIETREDNDIIEDNDYTIDIKEKDKPPKEEPIFNFPDSSMLSMAKEVPLYNVFAKEKGRFIKVNDVPLPNTKAFNLGAEVVDNTSSATFKVVKTNNKGPAQDSLFFNKKEKFRKKGNAYIELIKNRIDSPGEIQGITVKGWLANKRKGGLNGIL